MKFIAPLVIIGFVASKSIKNQNTGIINHQNKNALNRLAEKNGNKLASAVDKKLNIDSKRLLGLATREYGDNVEKSLNQGLDWVQNGIRNLASSNAVKELRTLTVNGAIKKGDKVASKLINQKISNKALKQQLNQIKASAENKMRGVSRGKGNKKLMDMAVKGYESNQKNIQ